MIGPPTTIYGFRSLFLPRLIAWQLSTSAIVLIALWLHAKLDKHNEGIPVRR
jgi:hypothetical protein